MSNELRAWYMGIRAGCALSCRRSRISHRDLHISHTAPLLRVAELWRGRLGTANTAIAGSAVRSGNTSSAQQQVAIQG